MTLILLLTAAMLLMPAADASGQSYIDMEAAIEWCDIHATDDVEGIWRYPDDGVTVLIKKVGGENHSHEIIVVESDRMTLTPGEEIGKLYATAGPESFRMKLFTKRRKGILCQPRDCSATLTAQRNGLRVTDRGKNFGLRINPLGLLPGLWKIVRMSTNKPAESLPAGMHKLYPTGEIGGTPSFNKRYL